MVAGLVVMGLHLVQTGGPGASEILSDTESVLPVVLGQLLPAGVKGVVLAGLIAAAMSTFDSTLNAGASYIVKDVYETYVKPDASGADLMKVSRYATIGLCAAGVLLSAVIPNINAIWGLITTALGPALFIPLFLRWYWPRFNGYGFAYGTGGGIIAALVVDVALELPLVTAFPTIVAVSVVTCVATTMLTPPTEDDVLIRFYTKVNPWGFWRPVVRAAVERGELTWKGAADQLWEKINDAIALCMAVPFQMFVLLAGMALVFHDWPKVGFFGLAGALCAAGLYFFWYKNLKVATPSPE
jgi:Na+/proline symporter